MVLETAGVGKRKVAYLSTSTPPVASELAPVLLRSPDGERQLSALLCKPHPDRAGWIDFHGCWIRRILVDPVHRRVSPRSLRQNGYLKSVWSVRCLSFDPGTREQLLSRCPVCGHRLGYVRAIDIHTCEACASFDRTAGRKVGVDLREFQQPVVEVADSEALDFVVSLIDPETASSFERFPICAALSGMNRGDLFELAVQLAGFLDPALPLSDDIQLYRPGLGDSAPINPEALAGAGRIVLDWPTGFEKAVEAVRTRSSIRSQGFGIRRELGPLLDLPRSLSFNVRLRDAVHSEIQADLRRSSETTSVVRKRAHRFRSDLFSITEASEFYGVNRRLIARFANEPGNAVRRAEHSKSPVLINRKEFEEHLEHLSRGVSRHEAAAKLGIHHLDVLMLLADQPLLEGIKEGALLDAASIDSFMDRIWSRAIKKPPRHARSLPDSVSATRRPVSNPWPKVIEKILDGSINLYCGGSGTGLAAFTVGDTAPIERINLERPAVTVPDGCDLNKSDACLMLKSSWYIVDGLVADGYLDAPSSMERIRKFDSEYALTSELITEMKEAGFRVRKRSLVKFFADRNVSPVRRLPGRGSLVWRRREVAEVLPRTDINRII